MILLCFTLAFVGFICLSLAMKRHYKQLYPNGNLGRNKVFTLRVSGSIFLLLSCLLCIQNEGPGIGLVLWFGLLTFAGIMQSMLLTYLPQFILNK